ncbi:restriction endonuclease subunit S [Lachnospira eligens]|uniref:restriction endonuclease subunit S n=1 Tax=Lachnospira eligens TaxID=39485 RepID=UPI001FAD4F8F|nr:restriction endonuclease subunit S [Lachnospira eligens]
MTFWNKIKLGEIATITSSKRIFANEYQTEGIPFYRGKEIIEKHNGNNVSTELYISRQKYEEIKSKFDVPKTGDILLSSVGTLGVPWLVDEEEFYFKDGNLTWLRCNEKVTCEFLYLWLNSPEAKNQINAMCIGSTQKALTIETLKKFVVTLPTLKIQKNIVNVINPIEKKIRVNAEINRNLSEQAKALFEEELLKFDSVPEGWKKGSLSDIADYLNGLAMQKFRPGDDEKGLPVLKIKELRQGSCDANSELCSLNIKPEYIIHDGDVIFSWSGSLLVDFWCGGECGLNQHLFKVTSKKYDKWFYYAWTLYHLDRFIAVAADKATTMGHIKREELSKAEVLIPDSDSYKRIGEVLGPLYDMIISNRVENRRLATLRDELLPMLMSGKMDVSEVEL